MEAEKEFDTYSDHTDNGRARVSDLLSVVLIFSDSSQASFVQQRISIVDKNSGSLAFYSGFIEKVNVLFKQLHEIPEKE